MTLRALHSRPQLMELRPGLFLLGNLHKKSTTQNPQDRKLWSRHAYRYRCFRRKCLWDKKNASSKKPSWQWSSRQMTLKRWWWGNLRRPCDLCRYLWAHKRKLRRRRYLFGNLIRSRSIRESSCQLYRDSNNSCLCQNTHSISKRSHTRKPSWPKVAQ